MTIQELSSKDRYKYATVTLNYDEIRCISNSFCTLASMNEDKLERDTEFDSVRQQFLTLFALVKYGSIPKFELDLIHTITDKIQEEEKK